VPRALLDAGIANVLAPIRTQASTLWHELDDGRGLVLHPFVAGRNAIRDGLTADQWRTFGTALQAVHDSDLADRYSGRLPTETFALPSAAVVRSVMELAAAPPVVSPPGKRLVAFLEEQRARLEGMLDRAEGLQERLRHRSFEHGLCHADIHAGNILLADDGRIFLAQGPRPERVALARRARGGPARLRRPLQRDRHAIRVALHPPRPPPRPRCALTHRTGRVRVIRCGTCESMY